MINLLPPARLLNMRTARTNTILRRYINLVIIGIIIIITSLGAAYYFLESRRQNVATVLEDHQKKVEELESVQVEAESLSTTVDTIASLLSRNIVFSDMLRSIGANMPPGSVLTGLQFSIETSDAPFVVSAEVENEGRAAVLRNNLLASGLFDSVEIKSITRKEDKQAPATNQPTTTDSSSEAPQGNEPPVAAAQESPYKYTTILNTTLKSAEAKR